MSSWDVFPKRFVLIPDALIFSCLISCDYLHKKVKWKVRLTESEIGNDSEIENEKRKWDWHQNVRNLIQNLIGKLIQMFWCQYSEHRMSGSVGKSPKFTFHLIKSDALAQTRTCLFS